MSKISIEKNWQTDPNIAQAVKGGEEYNTGDAVTVHDAQVIQLMQQVAVTLKKIEYHLSLMTDTDLTKENL